MQPLMVNLSREGNQCHVEIYCDNRDAGAKIAKTHTLELEDPTEESLQKVLNLLLQPLAPKNIEEKALQKATKHSQTFSEMFLSKESKILAEMNLSPVDPNASSAISEAPPRPLHTLEGILRAIESNTGQTFAASGELETTSKSPIDLVNRWISGKLDEGERSPEKALNALYQMTNAFVDDQLRQLSSSTPLDKQLTVYSDVVDHIDHVLGKVAHAIDTEYALGSSSLPTELKNKREKCLTKIAVLSEKVDKERAEGKAAVHAKDHDYSMHRTSSVVKRMLTAQSRR